MVTLPLMPDKVYFFDARHVTDLNRMVSEVMVPDTVTFDKGTVCTLAKPCKFKRAVNCFSPYKFAEPDDIFPELLQQGAREVQDLLLKLLKSFARIYTECMAISKSRSSHETPKDFCPICLNCFVFITLEQSIGLSGM